MPGHCYVVAKALVVMCSWRSFVIKSGGNSGIMGG